MRVFFALVAFSLLNSTALADHCTPGLPCSHDHKKTKIDQCVAREIKKIKIVDFMSGIEGPRCPGRGCWPWDPPNCNFRSGSVVYRADSGYKIISYYLEDHGRNDAVMGDEFVTKDNNGNIIALKRTLICDPPDLIGSHGGWNYGRYVGKLMMLPKREALVKSQLAKQCTISEMGK